MSQFPGVLEATLEALVQAFERALPELAHPPTNDPSAFERITQAARMSNVRTQQRPHVPPWETEAAVEEKLRELIGVLPLVPAHAPAQIRTIGGNTYELLLSDMTPAQRECVRDSVTQSIIAGQPPLPDAPSLAFLLRMLTLGDEAFPHGLVPPAPLWPDAIATLDGGMAAADEAYIDLHHHGWATAERHFLQLRPASLADARRLRDARIAFADCAVGATEAATVREGWRTYLLYQVGPGIAAEELGHSGSWSDGSDFAYANDILKRSISADDWTLAHRINEEMLAWEGEVDPDQRSSFEYRSRRVSKKFGTAERSAKVTRPKDARPIRNAAPIAPKRPTSAESVVHEAPSGTDDRTRQFMHALAANNPHRCVELLSEMANGGTIGHLWLLYELDNPWANGQILKHPALDDELQTWILRRARHGKNARPALSRYVHLFVRQRIEFAAQVLEHAEDEASILLALAEHGPDLGPGIAVALAKRTLSMPAKLATSITTAITKHMADRLPQEVLDVVVAAQESASSDRKPSAALYASLDQAQQRHPIVIPAALEEQSASQFIELLGQVDDPGRVEDLLHRWRGELPWSDLMRAIDDGELASEVVRRVGRRIGAPQEIVRRAVQLGAIPMNATTQESLRWLEALLDMPPSGDDELRSARVLLASKLVLTDRGDLRSRLPAAEWKEAATLSLLNTLGDQVLGHRYRVDDVDPRIFELGGQWIREDAVNVDHLIGVLPLPTACRLWFSAYPNDDEGTMSNALGEPVPAALEDWLTGRLADPTLGLEPGDVADAYSAIVGWQESLRDLVVYAGEFQDRQELE
ncbi:hypothetical protein GCM10009817_20880 [Terrabacter lapilli]|uniref:HEAT repeat protein n=2 Tax=Terrabacter lapilli TaxID=436231 RepID=A0ABP5DHB9_9MICO